jgi:hypothetical protein
MGLLSIGKLCCFYELVGLPAQRKKELVGLDWAYCQAEPISTAHIFIYSKRVLSLPSGPARNQDHHPSIVRTRAGTPRTQKDKPPTPRRWPEQNGAALATAPSLALASSATGRLVPAPRPLSVNYRYPFSLPLPSLRPRLLPLQPKRPVASPAPTGHLRVR